MKALDYTITRRTMLRGVGVAMAPYLRTAPRFFSAMRISLSFAVR